MPPSASAHAGATPGSAHLLLCRAGAITCGLPLEQVVETLRPLPIEPLHGMPSFVAGLSVIRGAPVPVVLLAQLLGNDSRTPASRLVVVRVQDRRVAIAVEEVIGLHVLRGRLGELPPLLSSAQADFVAAVGTLDERLLLVLEGWRVLPASTWATLLAAGGAA